MVALISFLLHVVASLFKSKSRLEAENAALRHQLIVPQRKVRGPITNMVTAATMIRPGSTHEIDLRNICPGTYHGTAARAVPLKLNPPRPKLAAGWRPTASSAK
jgi:hypothetical protein